jgi:hypothetical protein
MHFFFGRLFHFPVPRRALVMVVLLAWTSLPFGGEIRDPPL